MSESAAASIVYPCEGEGKMQPSGSGHNYQYTTEALKEERDGVWEFIKRLGMTFVEGKDLVSVSMPVTMCEPASFLERMTRGWVTMPRYCALIAGADTPLERMKLTVAMVISGLHINTNCKKPFNPLLGETHEASFEDGTEIFSEQTSHHPPVSSWEVHGTSGWRFTGTAQWSGYFAGNAVKGGQLGDNILELPDGYRVQWHLPSIHVSGVLTGNRVLDHVGFVEFKDNSEPPLVARIGFGDQRSNMEWVADGGKCMAPPPIFSLFLVYPHFLRAGWSAHRWVVGWRRRRCCCCRWCRRRARGGWRRTRCSSVGRTVGERVHRGWRWGRRCG